MTAQIRESDASDIPAVFELLLAAFGDKEGPEVIGLVNDLLVDPSARPSLSLVALFQDKIAGHIFFSKAHIKGADREYAASILAPLAVHPPYQSQGIGGKLIQEGLRWLKERGVGLVFVLGHASYYPKHGFEPALRLGLKAPHPIPVEHTDAWMVQSLQPGLIGEVQGQVICAKAMEAPKYWRE